MKKFLKIHKYTKHKYMNGGLVFSSQKKACCSSMRLFSPSFHCIPCINFASAEMAQGPPSAFKIAFKITVNVAGAVVWVQRMSFRGKPPTRRLGLGLWVRVGLGAKNGNSTYGSVSKSERSALLTQEDTLTQHLNSPFIPQCTLLFPLRCRCDVTSLHGFHRPALKVLHVILILLFLAFCNKRN